VRDIGRSDYGLVPFGRRKFLLLSIASSATALAAGRVSAQPALPSAAKPLPSPSQGYQLTAHVRRFYRSAGSL
jgi:hypothetical protein